MKFSDLICGQEPNNIITEEEININAMGQESVGQPKNHVIFFWLNDLFTELAFLLSSYFGLIKNKTDEAGPPTTEHQIKNLTTRIISASACE